MTSAAAPPVNRIEWEAAVRIIRSLYPPIDLFEDIADPADWPLLLSAEQKTNSRIMMSIGNIDLVPPERRVGGAGASFLMAPFTHVSTDRPSRFSTGHYGVLYVARSYETALFETIHHHGCFMARTAESAGWTSQFREIILTIDADLHDLRGCSDMFADCVDPDRYVGAQQLGSRLRGAGSNGIAYPSVRHMGGECAALFYPDCASNPVQGRHLDYHWDGKRVDLVRDAGSGAVFRVIES
ncbi:RES family NAD+ phosphorylase [Sphingobium sp. CCH11-B1]|uniref:RES family NAD+ phosphorylase n=1 Tax=Sphingobium sp. CCH11-B1 TaxID=1768781 RepID=UPI00082F37A2|nr:RES family NAD+ phosphorylase [Sphingobium sp. CCH11-B1]MEA3390934.1 RES family NAD+ phosphorylase [Pseudomonadota bacterium]